MPSETPQKIGCAVCGEPLPAGTRGLVCPSCAFGGALEEERKARGRKPEDSGQSLATLGAFGDYELVEEIARGGMGVVYKARQVSLDRLVAVKMILAGEFATPQFVQRFRTEASAAAVLHHPNIVAIYEVGVHAGQHYFSMDFVDGPSLAALVGHQPLPARRAVQYLKTIAEAIHYAHQQGILHRDLKPSNVLIDANDQPRITDFGLAKRLENAEPGTRNAELTVSGQVLGSPNFMPPEQATAKHGKVGRYSDVYALGGILYHLLTARPPFQADSLEVIVSQVLAAEPVSPRMLNPTVPRDLETICLKCLEKEPSRRYATAQALADELGRFLNGQPVQARPIGPTGKVWRWCRRKPLVAGLVAGLMFALALGLAGVLWQWRRAESQRARAEAGELLARQNAYAADMFSAQHALADNNRGLAVSLLDKYRPTDSSLATRHSSLATDLRHWEWRYLWQLCQGDELSTLHRFPRSIRAVAVSKDEKLLALACGDQVALWDLTTKRPLPGLPIATTEALAFSPTGNLLAVGTWNATGEPGVDLWDVSASKVTKTLTHEAEVRSVAFSPDGKLLATFDNRGNIKVADWASGQTLTNFTVPPPRRRPTGVVVFSPEGNRLGIGEDYGHVQLLDLRTGTVVPFQTQSGEGVTALVFSADAQLLAAGLGSAVRLWDANSGESRGQLTNHTDEVRALAFTPDSRQLASASGDGTIRIWSVADRAELRCLRSSRDGGLTALAMLSDGRTLVTGSDGGSVCLWDTTASSRAPAHTNWAVAFGFDSFAELEAPHFAPETLDPRAARRLGFAFTPDSRSFITTDRYGSLALWDARSVRVTEDLPALGSNHWGVALSPDGRWLAAGKTPGILTIWDWTARRVATNFTVPCEFLGWLGFSHSGNFLFAAAIDNEWVTNIRTWQTGDWEEVALTGNQFAGLGSVDLSPDDRLLATGFANGAVRLFRFPSGQHETTFTNHQASVTGVLFSPDGRRLFSTSSDRSARLWEVFARRELATLWGHFGSVHSPALSPDGVRLATGGTSPRDAVKLWDLVAHRELLTLQGEGQYFMHLAFSPDGNTLVAVSLDGMAHLWRVPSWEEIAAAEKNKGKAFGGVMPASGSR